MAQGLRDIKRRIRSTQATKKITRAMELIAASRVLKAQQRMQQALPYAEAITAALRELYSSAGSELTHSYLRKRDVVRNAAVLVVTSDKGLAGAYNSGVLREAEELLAKLRNNGVTPHLYVTGRKGAAFYKFRNREVAGSWTGFSHDPSYDDAKLAADGALEAFKNGEVDEIYVVYTNFISSFTQAPVARRLLPLEVRVSNKPVERVARPQYEYEPNAEVVLDQLLPRYIEARLFSAYLESTASFFAAQRRAMNTATENAGTLIQEYTRQYNQARQAAITQELMEVVGAAEAFSGSK